MTYLALSPLFEEKRNLYPLFTDTKLFDQSTIPVNIL